MIVRESAIVVFCSHEGAKSSLPSFSSVASLVLLGENERADFAQWPNFVRSQRRRQRATNGGNTRARHVSRRQILHTHTRQTVFLSRHRRALPSTDGGRKIGGLVANANGMQPEGRSNLNGTLGLKFGAEISPSNQSKPSWAIHSQRKFWHSASWTDFTRVQSPENSSRA